jgi:RNA polymerase sigma-70 factor (ECF subfamily)
MIHPAARGAWQELEAQLRPFVRRRVRSEVDVDDVIQDIFLRMLRGLGSLRDDDRFGPWVYQVARSAIADHLRSSAKHRVPNALEEQPEEPSSLPDDDTRVEQALAAHVGHLVTTLPSPYREALTLTELQGVTQNEAAKALGLSLSGMKSRVQRGRARLQRILEDCCHIACDARGHVLECEPRRTTSCSPACVGSPREPGTASAD